MCTKDRLVYDSQRNTTHLAVKTQTLKYVYQGQPGLWQIVEHYRQGSETKKNLKHV